MPEMVAHRGASYDAPENTVAAIKLAWEQKADGSEFDIYLTKDGKIVVIHDADTKRTAGVAMPVAKSQFDELRKLDIGTWKNAKYAGEKIPTLAEMFATVSPGKKVFVEVKCGPEIVPEMVKVMADSKLKPEQMPVISFNADVIAATKKARPDVPAYWLVTLNKKTQTVESLIAKAKEIHADGLDLSASALLDKPFADAIKKAGLKLYVWTVDDPKVAKRMAEIGVDGITTNRPQWLREQLAK
ncbi:glycerophosphodiester phosphodiesterase [Zavarzinella formosa]|uniref:glycerophosphodiester phosphodiesterase n=1 Tax=Zavarzinella formosa TaxID=360055 RepID=UPI000370C2F7|nr:glycerophosphodiester phosphodiesterase [Zavarzinella formosa]